MKSHLRTMLTLVSFPRSGNTFLRNVLFEVYGISSKTYLQDGHGPDEAWQEALVVKTHHLPDELPTELTSRPIVYLVRDGRDAVVSFAHHRKDVVAPESDFRQNLKESIYSAEGSHFGGWSKHVETWLPKAAVMIRFEELIQDPIGQCERLRSVMDLPAPNRDKLPTFQSLKEGIPEYGSGKYTHDGALAQHWFRKGRSGGWKEEMTQAQADLFWHLHGETMEHGGYSYEGGIFDWNQYSSESKRSLLIEGTKLAELFVDGIGRYVRELLHAAKRFPSANWEVEVAISGDSYALDEALKFTADEPRRDSWFQLAKGLARTILPSPGYQWLARNMPRSKVSVRATGKSKKTFDHALLTLPQHAAFLSSFSFHGATAVIHDATDQTHPEWHEENNILRSTEGWRWIETQRCKVIAVSKSTQHDLDQRGVRSEVVYEGVDRRRFFPIQNEHLKSLVRERYQLPKGPFLLSVATIEPRKNLQRLIDAYANLPDETRSAFPLVLTGRKGWKDRLDIPTSCRDQVILTGFVREDHLPALYTMAHGFCYVSLYEGFGLPVLEAMACGCPVLVSNTSSLPELVGEVGIQCDPTSLDSIQIGLEELIKVDRLQEEMSMMKQTWQFTWRESWLQNLQVIADQSRDTSLQRP